MPVRVLTVDDYGPFLAAFAAIDAAEPHLALIDVHMPNMNGIEATQ